VTVLDTDTKSIRSTVHSVLSNEATKFFDAPRKKR